MCLCQGREGEEIKNIYIERENRKEKESERMREGGERDRRNTHVDEKREEAQQNDVLKFSYLTQILHKRHYTTSLKSFVATTLTECQRLKAKVVQQIRSNKQLEQDLDVMDIKIGLLVKNRLTLQDLVSHSQQVRRKDKKANRHSQLLDGGAVAAAAVGGLTKANHEKVEVQCMWSRWAVEWKREM